jgi:hypothetical protein
MQQAEELQLDENWVLRLRNGGHSLGLSAVFCASGDLIYLFSNKPFAQDATPVATLPSVVKDLLLFEPIVPLRYSVGGFQALNAAEWSELTAVTMASYVGVNTLSNAQESNASVGGEPDTLEDESDDSGPGEDGVEGNVDDDLSSIEEADELDGSIASDGGGAGFDSGSDAA